MSALWAVVPAAGSGSRFGGPQPKQYLPLQGRSILEWSVGRLLACERIRGCAIALPAGELPGDAVGGLQAGLQGVRQGVLQGVLQDSRVMTCRGGATRAASVTAALRVLPAADEDWVLVHDAARPCLPAGDLERLIDRVLETGIGALLARPQTDTLKRADAAGNVTGTVDREGLWRAQTPQMFRVRDLTAALAASAARGEMVTDEASAMELAGYPVQVLEGPVCNLKVTFPADLALAGYWLAREQASDPAHEPLRDPDQQD